MAAVPLEERPRRVHERLDVEPGRLSFEVRASFPHGELRVVRGEREPHYWLQDEQVHPLLGEMAHPVLGQVRRASVAGSVSDADWDRSLGGARSFELELSRLTAETFDQAEPLLRFALGDPALVRGVLDAALEPVQGWESPWPVPLPEVLDQAGVFGFDLRLATMHMGELTYCLRNVRALYADDWLITLWGAPIGAVWTEYSGYQALPGRGKPASGSIVTGEGGAARWMRYVQDILWHNAWSSHILGSRLEHWEARFYTAAALTDEAEASAALPALRRELALLGDFLAQLRLAERTMRRRSSRPWFPAAIRDEVVAHCDQLAAEGRHHRSDVRDGFALMTSVASSRQADIAERRQETDRHFQATVGLLAAIVLVPTLIVGIYGAEVRGLPGREQERGLYIMLVAAIAGAGLTWAILRYRITSLERRRRGAAAQTRVPPEADGRA